MGRPMLVQPLPKPQRIRSRATIRAMRKPYCEVCGRPAFGEPHHIRSRGAGGEDIPANLIQLCVHCHYGRKHSRAEAGFDGRLIAIVAAREGLTPEQVRRAIGWEAP